MAGRIDGICTAPLNEALHAGGHKYPGHIELFSPSWPASRKSR